MAYSDFTLIELQRRFNIVNKVVDLFDNNQINPLQPSAHLLRACLKFFCLTTNIL